MQIDRISRWQIHVLVVQPATGTVQFAGSDPAGPRIVLGITTTHHLDDQKRKTKFDGLRKCA